MGKNRLRGKEFEELVARVVEELQEFKGAEIYRNRRYDGIRQPGRYEIDVAVEHKLSDRLKLLYLIECKHYRRPVDRPQIQKLAQTREALSAHKGIVVSKTGFTLEAISVAKTLGIALWVVSDKEITPILSLSPFDDDAENIVALKMQIVGYFCSSHQGSRKYCLMKARSNLPIGWKYYVGSHVPEGFNEPGVHPNTARYELIAAILETLVATHTDEVSHAAASIDAELATLGIPVDLKIACSLFDVDASLKEGDHKVNELFDEYTSALGGSFDVSRFDEGEIHLLGYLNGLNELCGRERIYIRFIDNKHVNAVAFNHRGVDFIGIYYGAVKYIADASIAICGLVDPFQDGDLLDMEAYHKIKRHLRGREQYYWTLSEDQHKFLRALFIGGMAHLICHEYAHFRCGHIDYIKNVKPDINAALFEVTPPEGGFRSILERTLKSDFELDADLTGLEFTLQTLGMFEVDWLNEPVTKFNVPSKYFALELITHVLFLRFLMFADELPDYEQDHPHPLIRGHLAASGISAWLRATASVKESKGFDDWLQSKLHAKVIWEMQYMFFGPQHLSKYYNDSNTEENIKQKIDLLIESLEKTLLLVKEFASSRDAK